MKKGYNPEPGLLGNVIVGVTHRLTVDERKERRERNRARALLRLRRDRLPHGRCTKAAG